MTSAKQDAIAKVRKSLTVLYTVAILQPVSGRELEQRFPDAKHTIKSLEQSGMVRKLEDGNWVITARGLGVASTREIGRKRDILRMFELIERTRRG